MSKQLTVSAALSVFAMAAFTLVQAPRADAATADTPVHADASAFELQADL